MVLIVVVLLKHHLRTRVVLCLVGLITLARPRSITVGVRVVEILFRFRSCNLPLLQLSQRSTRADFIWFVVGKSTWGRMPPVSLLPCLSFFFDTFGFKPFQFFFSFSFFPTILSRYSFTTAAMDL